MIKAVVERKEAAWKKVLGAKDEVAKERCMVTKKKKVKRCIYQRKNEVNEQFGRKINQDVNENKKLFWKEMSNSNGGKVKRCSRIKD